MYESYWSFDLYSQNNQMYISFHVQCEKWSFQKKSTIISL